MALSPEDIVNHEFKQALRGYAVQEVDDLLDRLADQLERAERDIVDLRQRLVHADARATEALATEASLKLMLITAQDAAQRTMDDAQTHAESVRSEADRQASERLDDAIARSAAMLEGAEDEAVSIRASYRAEQEAAASRIVELATIEDRYRTQLRSLLEQQLTDLEAVEAAGAPGGHEVAELRDALHGATPESTNDEGGSHHHPHEHGSDSDDPLVPFGGLTVRVGDGEDSDSDRDGDGDRDPTDDDGWGGFDEAGEPQHDPTTA